MKWLKLKFGKSAQLAHEAGREHIRQRPYIVPILGLVAGVAIVLAIVLTRPHSLLRPSDFHVVFLNDNGVRTTLDTKEPTVGALVNKLPLHLIAQDVVEPSADTPIVQDNFRINVYRARPVTVVAPNGSKTVTLTAQKSARVVAQAAGLTVYPEDYADFAPGSVSQGIIGEQVVITPATPVQLTLYDTPETVRTHKTTVGGLLAEKGVKLGPKDTVSLPLSTPITANLAVSVVRNGVHTETVTQVIPAPIQYVNDSSLTFGATAVRQAGSNGAQAITYQVDVEHGVEVSRTIIQQTTVTPAVPRIIAVGTIIDVSGDKTAVMAAAGISTSDYGYVDYIVSHESGWCYTKAQGEHYCPAQPDNAYTSYGYGLCQATPGYKMSTAGGDWATNPLTQLHWCSGYAASRYGSWYAAYSHWLAYHNW